METPSTVRNLRRLFERAFHQKLFISPKGEGEYYLRFVLFLNEVQTYLESELPSLRSQLVINCTGLIADYYRLDLDIPFAVEYLKNLLEELETAHSDPVERSAWRHEAVSDHCDSIPNMLYADTKPYYKWLTRSYSGKGQFVEIGCWLGASTACLAEGLRANPHLNDRKLHVFDSFIWQDYMRLFLKGQPHPAARLTAGDSFLPLFRRHCRPYRDLLDVTVCSLEENGAAGGLGWRYGPIGVLVLDAAYDSWFNQWIWDDLSPYFVPRETIIAVHPYGNKRAEALRGFFRGKAGDLAPVHKPFGSAKSFLFAPGAAARTPKACSERTRLRPVDTLNH